VALFCRDDFVVSLSISKSAAEPVRVIIVHLLATGVL
jgi:hypothetical protein